MLSRIYEVLLLFREYAMLAVLLLASLLLLALNDNAQMKHVRSVLSVGFGFFQQQAAFVPGYFQLRSENEMLREMNMRLSDEANQLREAKLENFRLKQLLAMKEEEPEKFMAAKVVGKNYSMLRNTITLNAGSLDGVQPRMTVVNDRGLVGIVSTVSSHYCIVTLVLNVEFRASAKVQRSRVDGIITWNGSALQLRNVAKTLDVKPGDVIITSEYSSTYPGGIKIGVVGTATEERGTLFKQVSVIPSVDFVRLEEVFIISSLPDEERKRLETLSAE